MELPVLLVTDGVLYPNGRMKIPVRSQANVAMIESCLLNSNTNHTLIAVAYKSEQEINGKKVYPVATTATVDQVMCWSANNSRLHYTLHLVGVSRVRIEKFATPMCLVKQLYSTERKIQPNIEKEFIENVKRLLMTTYNESSPSFRQLKSLMTNVTANQFDEITDLCMTLLQNVSYNHQLTCIAELDVGKRTQIVNEILKEYFKTSQFEEKKTVDPLKKFDDNIMSVLDRLTKGQVIPGDRRNDMRKPRNDAEMILQKLEAAGLPEGVVRDTVMEEFEKFKNTPNTSPEHSILRSYLLFVADLPWNKSTDDKYDIKKSRVQLDADHEGMEEVKKRILEFLAVKQLKNELKGPILCLAGPPGVGKTSIAKSIAQSLGRNFQRIALGGIRDQSDIRGHRKTYVGAMPGRILHAIKAAKSNNPVILLDEVDKIGPGPQGDPSAALLEVLDPEQNNSFTDLYLNVPFDLSKILFLATANDVRRIPAPLLDRMELVELTSYSTDEKMKIAMQHILPKQLERHALSPEYMKLEREALLKIIENYTREAGVRQLERVIGSVCRNIALRIAESINGGSVEADIIAAKLNLPIVVNVDEVRKILGKEKYVHTDMIRRQTANQIGIAFGLAWTPFGGEVLVIETVLSSGTGKVVLTGKLGDIIKESIQVALSWIRSHANQYELNVGHLEKSDLHVHLPAGAIGKDGPSAGCAFTLALFSLLSGKRVRRDSAVTGEVTLTGKVLPVGGIKEKILAAHRNGIFRAVLPKDNLKEVVDLDENIRKSMEVVFVDDVDELIRQMIDHNTPDILSKL